MFDIFDKKTIRRLIGQMGTKDASAVAKAIDKVVNGLRDAFNVYADQYADTQEIVKLRGDLKKMDEIRGTFFKELRAASENFKKGATAEGNAEQQYATARENSEIYEQIQKAKSGNYTDKDSIALGPVTQKMVEDIKNLLGIDVSSYQIVIQTKQIKHILDEHGENGTTDRSMKDDRDIAKIQYVINNYDDIAEGGRTDAYYTYENGKNKTAKTVIYEKNIGNNSQYVIQAVPE